VKPLLKYGADPTVNNKDGNTPLDVARREGRHEVVSLIEKWLEEETNLATASQRPPRLAGLPRQRPSEVAKKAQVSQQVVKRGLQSPGREARNAPRQKEE
jgi:hypothetical protein